MSFKSRIHKACVDLIHERIKSIEDSLTDLRSQLAADSKSSAGDKHETSRAMVHLEQEQLFKQLHELNLQLSVLNTISPTESKESIGVGSLIETTNGIYYLGIGLGRLRLDEIEVNVVSPQSPIGHVLAQKKAGDMILFHGQINRIQSIS